MVNATPSVMAPEEAQVANAANLSEVTRQASFSYVLRAKVALLVSAGSPLSTATRPIWV